MHFCCRAPHGARGLKSAWLLRELWNLSKSRPAWGAWIEIFDYRWGAFGHLKSRPAWGAWIEIRSAGTRPAPSRGSRPAWGAWIEIERTIGQILDWDGRAPHGARGLKYVKNSFRFVIFTSRPAWGAWIEIGWKCANRSPGSGRAPHGARGLKSHSHVSIY